MPILTDIASAVTQEVEQALNPFGVNGGSSAANVLATKAATYNRVPGSSPLTPSKVIVDEFWVTKDIEPSRWNKQYPYQLLVLKHKNGTYSKDSDWEFTLPIPPESMTINTPFAITTQVTMNGIVEEHNGAPIRNISFSGTTGIYPGRDSSMSGTSGDGSLGGAITNQLAGTSGIFAGTVQAASAALDNNLLNVFTDPNKRHNTYNPSDFSSALPGQRGAGTGYYQFQLLQKFLEAYVTIKKRAEGKDLRLALAFWKEQAIYLVTPVNFEVRRSASDPLAYNYQLSFKAWRRVDIQNTGGEDAIAFYRQQRANPSYFQQALNVIQDVRELLNDSRATLEALRADVKQAIFEPMRQTALFLKDATGLAAAIADFPDDVIQDAKGAFIDGATAIGTSTSSNKLKTAVQGSNKQTQSLSASIVAGTQQKLGNTQPTGLSASNNAADAIDKAFSNPQSLAKLASKVNTTDLKLSPAVQRKINAEVNRVRSLRRSDFEAMRDNMERVVGEISEAMGAGDETYRSTYNKPSISTKKNGPSVDDYEVLFALNRALMEMNKLAVAGPEESAKLQAIDYVAGLARRSGIAFRQPASKFAIPFPYGSTLEYIALRYLGDANRWHEIAALNGLRTPYVDEEGFELPLLTIGVGNRVTLADATNLYIGQLVTLSANNTTRTQRRITKIEQISAGMVFVTVDGDPDMGRYTPLGQAVVHAYLPDTVNSSMQLYIPSQKAISEQELTAKSIPGVNDFTHLLDAGGVDLLLTSKGDLAITPDGDCKLAIGLANLVQRVRVAITTPRGSLPQHPTYGLAIRPGTSTADVDAKQLLEATKSLFKDDPSFTGVFAASVNKDGTAANLSVAVGVAGSDAYLPVSVEIKR